MKFTYGDKEYTLEFTRRTVTEMERKGFVAADVETKPMSRRRRSCRRFSPT